MPTADQPVRLVVFDLDGTLVDTRADLAAAVNDVALAAGGDRIAPDLIGQLVGEGVETWVPRALAAAGIAHSNDAMLDQFRASYARRIADETRPYPGIPEALRSLRPARIAVLTNKGQAATEQLLGALDLVDSFDVIAGLDGRRPAKPDPGGLEAIMRQFGASREETVLIGDSPIDVETARRAAVRICVARYGFGVVPAMGNLPGVNSPAEIPAFVRIL